MAICYLLFSSLSVNSFLETTIAPAATNKPAIGIIIFEPVFGEMPEEFLFPVFEFGLLGSTSFVALPLRPLYLPLPEPEPVVVSSFLIVFCFFVFS